MALASQWPIRQWLMFMLEKMLVEKLAPAINQGFADALLVDPARQTLPGFVLPIFGEANITRGELDNVDGPTIALKTFGRVPVGDTPTMTYYRSLRTRILWKAPKIGLNAPEDIDLFHSIMEDTLDDFLSDVTRFVLTPRDPDTNAPCLPGGASFARCEVGQIQPMPMPVKQGDGVTYVHGGYCDHYAFFEMGADRPYRIL